MRIKINDQGLELTEQSSLAELLSAQNIDTTAIAVALNGKIMHRGHWQQTKLNDGDTITLVQAVAGG
ncbi:sulfur carrier protein ThiS [Idiomarina aminovorans]|uniref:sulfur carrier protein ThiS n=1 Tax=Idiomarina aminovorans TaxID=2914829 RepID=UPI002003E3E1|nr:sulfur carrier protein ThiS [Idiomarina sp. ATCH4]MCK7458744.1 sulfur carrier protein ThiS [Idiomarina sp. ATCH4]